MSYPVRLQHKGSTDFNFPEPTNELCTAIAQFIGSVTDVGLYLIIHYSQGFSTTYGFSNAVTGVQLAAFVNKLPVHPRKICIAACKAAYDQEPHVVDFAKG